MIYYNIIDILYRRKEFSLGRIQWDATLSWSPALWYENRSHYSANPCISIFSRKFCAKCAIPGIFMITGTEKFAMHAQYKFKLNALHKNLSSTGSKGVGAQGSRGVIAASYYIILYFSSLKHTY